MKVNKEKIFFFSVLLVFILYLIGIYPSITNGDSGEFLSQANILGIAHPSGYPLYILILKLFISIFHIPPAFAGNLMSAFFAAGTIGFLYLNLDIFAKLYLKNISYRKISAFIAAILLAITPVFFSQAILTEVYTLNSFFLLLLNYIFLIYIKSKKGKYLTTFFFLYGIGLTNHLTLIIFAPIYVVIIYKNNKSVNNYFKYILFFLLGISVYLYLIIRANASNINWAHPDSLYKLFLHITRAEYKNMNLVPNRNLIYFLKQIYAYLILLFKQFNFFVIIGILGIFYMQRVNKKINIILILFYIVSSLFFIYYLNTRLDAHILYTARVFYIPSFFIFSVWIFTGFLFLFNLSKIIIPVILILVIIMFYFNYKPQRNNYIALDFSKNILKTINYQSALFTVEGDNPLFALAYLNRVEHRRPDIDFCNRYGKIFKSSAEYFRNLTSITEKELYFTSPERMAPEYKPYLKQTGILYKLIFKPEKNSFINYYDFRTPSDADDFMDKGLAAIYYFRLAYFYKTALNDKIKFFKYLKISAEYGDELEDIQKNVGDIYFNEKKFNAALKYYKQIIKINPYNSKAYFYIGLCEMNKNNYYVALSFFKKAYKLNLRTLNFYKVFSYTLYKLNNVYEALKYLNEARDLYPNDKRIYDMLRRYTENE